MGYFLTKTPRTPTPCRPKPPRRPSLPVIRAMLVRQKEICWYIAWWRRGSPENGKAAAQRILAINGQEACCACDVCWIDQKATLHTLRWVLGEVKTF